MESEDISSSVNPQSLAVFSEIPSHILDDLCSRFIINLPEEERNDFIRLCFHIELAHWFYLDFYIRELTDKKVCGMKEFAYQIFRHIPYLQPYANYVGGIIDEWRDYKFLVPTFGAILLDENMSHVLLVQSYKSSWGFPKGKINKDEPPCQCAIREVYEETGFNIANLIDPKEYIEAQINEHLVRLYIVPRVSRTIIFAPKTRNEIKAVNWFSVTELSGAFNDATVKLKSALGSSSFFLVSPFISRLRQWIFEHDKKIFKRYRSRGLKSCGDLESNNYSDSPNYAKFCKFYQCVDALKSLSLIKISPQLLNVREKKMLKVELLPNDSMKKTINHDENSPFVEAPESSVSAAERDEKTLQNIYQTEINKPLPFQPIKLSDSFLEHDGWSEGELSEAMNVEWGQQEETAAGGNGSLPPMPPPPPPQWHLDMDLRHHIQHCACTCNHMGYGNYMDYQVWAQNAAGYYYCTQCLTEMPGRMLNGSARFNCQTRALIPGTRGSVTSSSSEEERLELRPWVVACLLVTVICGIGLGLALILSSSGGGDEEDSADSPEHRMDQVRRILQEVPLIDGHNDLPWNIRKFVHNQLGKFNFSDDLRMVEPWSKSNWSHTDLPRLRAGLVGAQFWSAYVPCGSQHLDAVQVTMEQIDVIKRLTQIYSSDLQFVTTVEGIREAHKSGRIASLIGVEGGHSFGSSLGVLRMFYGLGARYLTLTHTCHTPWAGCCLGDDSTDPENQGLSHFGRLVVRELNRLGMLVDLSHTSFKTMEHALNVSTAPIIFSHSSAFAICNSTRNVPDYILKLVALNGGIVMVNFYTYFISCNQTATMEDVIAHINHIKKVAGDDHVGIGAGYDGINTTPSGLEDVSHYPELLAALLASGEWTELQLKKLAGLNLLRVMSSAEQVRDNWQEEGVTVVEELIAASGGKLPSDCVYMDS